MKKSSLALILLLTSSGFIGTMWVHRREPTPSADVAAEVPVVKKAPKAPSAFARESAEKRQDPAARTAAPATPYPAPPPTHPAAAPFSGLVDACMQSIRAHDVAGADALLQKNLDQNPDDAKLQSLAGLLYLYEMHLPGKAVPLFEQSLDRDPGQPEVLSSLVKAYSDAKQNAHGADFLRDLSESRYPQSVGPALAYADLLARGGQGSDAAQYLESRAATLEAPGEAYAMAGASYLAMREPADAEHSLTLAAAYYEEKLAGESGQGPSRQVLMEGQRNAKIGLTHAYLSQVKLAEAEAVITSLAAERPDDKAVQALRQELDRRLAQR